MGLYVKMDQYQKQNKGKAGCGNNMSKSKNIKITK